MSMFSRVYKTYTFGGGGVCENLKKIHTLFSLIFYYFHGDFWHSKNVDVYSFWGERGSQKVYGLYTCENSDIYGQPFIG